MPLVVPRVTTCLRDTKKEVAKAARTALIEACSVIGNPDIAPVVPSVISAIKDPDKVSVSSSCFISNFLRLIGL